MNLLMTAPLCDSRGTVRYFIGAQIDVTGLVKEGTELDAFRRMVDQEEGVIEKDEPKDEFQALCEMFNNTELDTTRRFGGNMHREHLEEKDDATMQHKPRVLIQDRSNFDLDGPEKSVPSPDGRLSGPYKHVSLTWSLASDFGKSNRRISTLSFALRRLYAFSLHLLHFASPEYFSLVSLTGLVAVTVFVLPSVARSQMARAASLRRSAGYRTQSRIWKMQRMRADLAGSTALHSSARMDL